MSPRTTRKYEPSGSSGSPITERYSDEISLPTQTQPSQRHSRHRARGRLFLWTVGISLLALTVYVAVSRGFSHIHREQSVPTLADIDNQNNTSIAESSIADPADQTNTLQANALSIAETPKIQTPERPTRRAVSSELHNKLVTAATYADVAYCVGPPGPGLSEPFNCLGRCSTMGDVRLIKAWSGLGLNGEGRGATGGYLALSMKPSPSSPSSPDSGSQDASLMIVFRGTYSIIDALSDLALQPQPYKPYNSSMIDLPSREDAGDNKIDCANSAANCSVHAGFLSSWHAARPVVLEAISTILANSTTSDRGLVIHPKGDSKPVTLTDIEIVGHSLGGAVACLAGLDMVRGRDHPTEGDQLHPQLPVTVTTFGEPRVGNVPFSKYVDHIFPVDIEPRPSFFTPVVSSLDKYYRVTHQGDPVPLLPPRLGSSQLKTAAIDDPTALYSAHSHEIFIVPEHGVDVKPEDVLICEGRADEACSIGKDGQNEAFFGAEGRFWKWIGRRIAGQDNDSDSLERGRRRMNAFIADLRDYEAGKSTSSWQKFLPNGGGPRALFERLSFWKSKVPPVEGVEEKDVNTSLLPLIPAPIWIQVRSHRQYLILLGLCVPPGWGW